MKRYAPFIITISVLAAAFLCSACSDSELFGYEPKTAADKNLYVVVEGPLDGAAFRSPDRSGRAAAQIGGGIAGYVEAVDESGAKYASTDFSPASTSYSLKFKLAAARRLFVRIRESGTDRCFLQSYLGKIASPSSANITISNAAIDAASTGIAVKVRDSIAGRTATAQEAAAAAATVCSSFRRPPASSVLDPASTAADMVSDPVYSNVYSLALVSPDYVKTVRAAGAASLMLHNASLSASSASDLSEMKRLIDSVAENGTEFQSALSVTGALARVINGVIVKSQALKTSFESRNASSGLSSFSLGAGDGAVTIDPRSASAIDENRLALALTSSQSAVASQVAEVPYIANIRVGASELYSMSPSGTVTQTSPVEVSKTPDFTVTFSQNVTLNPSFAGMRARITENANSVVKYKYIGYGAKKMSGDYGWEEIFGSAPSVTNNVMTFRVSDASPVKLANPAGPAVVTVDLLEFTGFFSASRATVPAVSPGLISGSFTTVK